LDGKESSKKLRANAQDIIESLDITITFARKEVYLEHYNYSSRKLSTGLIKATLMLCKLTVNKTATIIAIPYNTKNCYCISM